MGGHEQGPLTQLRFTTYARSVPPVAREVLEVGHLFRRGYGSRRYFGRALRITARMCIAAPAGRLGLLGAAARLVATSAPRPGWARGRVTYEPYVMRNTLGTE